MIFLNDVLKVTTTIPTQIGNPYYFKRHNLNLKINDSEKDDSETNAKYVPFDVYDKPSKNNLRRRKPNERLATKEDRRAYETLGLKAPVFVPR